MLRLFLFVYEHRRCEYSDEMKTLLFIIKKLKGGTIMKQFLFRGKTGTDENARWAYGSLIVADKYCCILEREEDLHPMDVPYLDGDLGWFDGKATPVVPETVGRMIDNEYDIELFEGDIVATTYEFEIEGDVTNHVVLINERRVLNEYGFEHLFPVFAKSIRVIGNIWDNPELVDQDVLYKYMDK